MNKGFTKIYKQERELLKQTKSVACYEVYMHLKDDYNYFNSKNNKTEIYDMVVCISEYLDIPQRTVKDAIRRLKDIGLISIKKGKNRKNIYSFPILDAIKNGTEIPQEDKVENNINNIDDMGNFSGYNINNNTLEQTQETQYSPVGQYNDDEDLTRFPNEEDSFPPVWSEEKQCYMGINNKPQQEETNNIPYTAEEPKFYDYCDEMGELLDSDDIFTINNILARGIDYLDFGKTEYEVFAKEGTGKIIEIANKYFDYKENNRARADLFNYVAEYNKDYKESIINKQNEYDRYEYDAA